MQLEKFEAKIRQWASDRGIIPNATKKDQLTKVMEEVGEIAAAIARNDEVLLADAIGDAMITIILLAQISDLSAADCLESAWSEISDRTGELKDGIFVKD